MCFFFLELLQFMMSSTSRRKYLNQIFDILAVNCLATEMVVRKCAASFMEQVITSLHALNVGVLHQTSKDIISIFVFSFSFFFFQCFLFVCSYFQMPLFTFAWVLPKDFQENVGGEI